MASRFTSKNFNCITAQLVFIIVAILNPVSCQNEYYPPIRINVGTNFGQRFFPPSSYILSADRRSGECSHIPGSSCMFVLLCLMRGGVASGSCSGGILSTCCSPAPPTQIPVVTSSKQPSRIPVDSSDRIIKASHARNTTEPSVVKYVKDKNITYCGIAKAKPQSRIIGGDDALYGEFPWQAHIKLKKQQCGGVLLNNYYVLTAAHCIYQVRLPDMTIQLGVYDIQDTSRQSVSPQTFQVVEKKIHPRFQYQAAHPDRFDVALLKLDRAARYQDHVLPICLPKKDWNFEGWKGVITGWGKTDPGLHNRYGTRILQKVEVPIISNSKCERWHHEKGIDITLSDEMLCAGYERGEKDACVGDSGGPLMVLADGRWVVVGLVSAGFGCAQSKQPGIYHRVQHTVDWLLKNIAS